MISRLDIQITEKHLDYLGYLLRILGEDNTSRLTTNILPPEEFKSVSSAGISLAFGRVSCYIFGADDALRCFLGFLRYKLFCLGAAHVKPP